jgi:hypothetical protein
MQALLEINIIILPKYIVDLRKRVCYNTGSMLAFLSINSILKKFIKYARIYGRMEVSLWIYQ